MTGVSCFLQGADGELGGSSANEAAAILAKIAKDEPALADGESGDDAGELPATPDEGSDKERALHKKALGRTATITVVGGEGELET